MRKATRRWIKPPDTPSPCASSPSATISCRTSSRSSQRAEPRRLELVAVEQVVGVEGNHPPVGMDDVDARLLHRAHVERVGVDELHDQDAEEVLVAETR